MSPLLLFLMASANDHAHRSIIDIWDWNDEKLEEVHDYIQWLFPNREPSAYNPSAPLLTDNDVAEIRKSTVMQGHMQCSFERMCNFYKIAEGPPYWWDSRGYAHNWLRMTRILLCLNECGMIAQATTFHEAINKASLPDNRTRAFWFKAARRPTDP